MDGIPLLRTIYYYIALRIYDSDDVDDDYMAE